MTAPVDVWKRILLTASHWGRVVVKASHNGFALLGVALASLVIGLAAQPEVRRSLESKAAAWLHQRQFQLVGMNTRADAVGRATAADPKDLPRQQAAVTYWLSTKYRVAPEPLAALVAEAYRIADKADVDPILLLAIMAIESGFNPFAQSNMGAQGLMQVMTRVHSDKYDGFGGVHAAFDPVTNLRVGARVLDDCITRRGSVEGGLRCYVGATPDISDGGYVNKVMAEFNRLQQVADRKPAPNPPTPNTPAKVAAVGTGNKPNPVTTPTPAAVAPSTGNANGQGAKSNKAPDSAVITVASASPSAPAVKSSAASKPPTEVVEPRIFKANPNGVNARGIPDAIAPFMMVAPAPATTTKPAAADKTRNANTTASGRVS